MGFEENNSLEKVRSHLEILTGLLFPDENLEKFKIQYYVFKGGCADEKTNLKKLIFSKNFCEAEDSYFKLIDEKINCSPEYLKLGCWMYSEINENEEVVLNENNFSHEEVIEGVDELIEIVKHGFKK